MCNKYSGLRFLSLICLFLVIKTNAENNLNNQWSNLSEDQYVNNLIECQTKIKQLQWSHSIWPKDNPNEKPKFFETINIDHAHWRIDELIYNSRNLWLVLDPVYGVGTECC
jgi:hypothetical protein